LFSVYTLSKSRNEADTITEFSALVEPKKYKAAAIMVRMSLRPNAFRDGVKCVTIGVATDVSVLNVWQHNNLAHNLIANVLVFG
jgi:hypothetical protein